VAIAVLVCGFSNAETRSWSALATVIALAASAALLPAFVIVERRTRSCRCISCGTVPEAGRTRRSPSPARGSLAVFLFLTFYMQQSEGFSPIQTGLAFLPMAAMTGITVQTKVLPRTGAKPLLTFGMTSALAAMLIFTRLSAQSGYASQVLPGLLLVGLGAGCVFAPAFGTGTLGVDTNEADIAPAMINTAAAPTSGHNVGTTRYTATARSFTRKQ
jgi:hypothetical protein